MFKQKKSLHVFTTQKSVALSLFSTTLFSAALFAQVPSGAPVYSGSITNPASRLCLDVARASADDGLNVQLGSCENGTASWDLIALDRGDYALINRLTKRSLDVAGGSSSDGVNIRQYTWNGTTSQRWRISNLPNGNSQIINAGNGKCLDIANRGTTAGSNVSQWSCHGGENQQWRVGRLSGATNSSNLGASPAISVGGERPSGATNFNPTQGNVNDRIKLVDGRLRGRTLYSGMIVSRHSSKCIDVQNARDVDGTNIQQWTCNSTSAQLWDFLDAGNGEMVIVARASRDKVMDVTGANKSNGANIAQFFWNGGANQRWRLEATAGGFFKIVSVDSNKCVDLDTSNQSNQDGANIWQWDCHGKDNQQWRIEISGVGAGWSNYKPQNTIAPPQANYSDLPPANMIGVWQGYNPIYQSTIRLTINPDGTALAELEGNLRVNGYFRQKRLYLGAERYDIQTERRGFKTIQVGQSNNTVSYTRAR